MAQRAVTGTDEVSFDLGDLLAFFWARKIPIVLTAVVLIAVGYTYLSSLPKRYAASTTLLLASDAGGLAVPGLSAFTNNNRQMDTYIEFIRSRNFLAGIVEDLELQFEEEFLPISGANKGVPDLQHTVSVIQEDLSITVIANTDMVKLTFQAKDPELAARVVNEVGPAFFAYEGQREQQKVANATAWLNQQIDDIRETLTESESKLQGFLEENQLVDVGSEMTLLQSEIVALNREGLAIDRQLSELRASFDQLALAAGNRAAQLQVPFVAKNEFVRSLRGQIQQQQMAIEELAKRYKEKHYKYVAAQTVLTRLYQELDESITGLTSALEQQIGAVSQRASEIDNKIALARKSHSELGNLEIKMTRLRREVESNQQLYEAFLSRLQEAEVLRDLSSQQNFAIIDAAQVPIRPVSPRMALGLAVIAILSFMFASAVWLVIHLLSDKRTRYRQILARHGIALLAEVPRVSSGLKVGGRSLGSSKHAQALYDEAIRNLRTAIIVAGNDKPKRLITITGVHEHDGHNDIAASLAASFSNLEKTLLIDGNMRQAVISRQFELPDKQLGLTDIINNKAPFSNSIVRLPERNVTLLPTGSVLPDPAALFTKPRLISFLNKLSIFYERLLVSTPAVSQYSDTLILSKHADGVVMVCDIERTERNELIDAIRQLSDTGTPLIGVVLNQVKGVRKRL